VAEAAPALLYLPALPAAGTRFELVGPEAHYVARVCRARAGERIEATDGRGARARLRLVEVRGSVSAEVETVTSEALARAGWVLCGAPEGERADWLVEKLAELGIARFQPVDTARAAWRRAAGRHERWERLAIAALRQSRRSHLMAVGEPLPLERALRELPEGCGRWLAEAGGEPLGRTGPAGGAPGAGLIGPSPGFEDRERDLARQAGFATVRLADARLRTETAALAWAAWWAFGCP
jgi:16S rRNA (uracil1498-N3)-methyltransferase